MNFRDTIEGYIKEKNSNSRGTYAPRINLFANFLQNEKEVGDKLSEILDEIIGRQDITGLRKYVIIEMIRKGINQSFIMKLAGAGSTKFEDCQRIVNKERHVEANRYIDSKMRDMVLFDCL